MDFYADFSLEGLVMFEDPEENRLFVESLQGTDMALSDFAVYHFRNRFHCTSQRRWYEYRGHCWHEDAADLVYKEALGKQAFVRPYKVATQIFEKAAVQTDDVVTWGSGS